MDDIFRSYIIPAVIGATSALIVGMLDLFKYFRNRRDEKDKLINQLKYEFEINRSNNSIQYITDKRVDWIYEVREVASDYISLVYELTTLMQMKKTEDSEYIKIYSEVTKKANKLKLFLNFTGGNDSLIMMKIENVDSGISSENYNVARKNVGFIIMHLQIYLKLEWNRVNSEVKSGVYSKEQYKKEMIELYSQYPYKDESEMEEIKKACTMLKIQDSIRFTNGD